MPASRQITAPKTALLEYYTLTKGACANNPLHSHTDKTLLRCSKCKAALYCGAPCQEMDWPRHKQVCKILKDQPTQAVEIYTPIATNPTLLFLDCLAEDLNRIAIQTIMAIARDHKLRMQGYASNPELLHKGIFYPLDYYKALIETKQTETLQTFAKEGHFFHGYADPKLFEMVPHERCATGMRRMTFTAKEGVSASDALSGLLRGPSILDCSTTCQVAYWKAIQGVLGDKFDRFISPKTSAPFAIFNRTYDDLPENGLDLLMNITVSHSDDVMPGQITNMRNPWSYLARHSDFSHKGGYVMICCSGIGSETRYTTLGLKPEGESREEITERLRNDYNETPFDFEAEGPFPVVTDEVKQKMAMSNKKKPPHKQHYSTLEEFKEDEGGKMSPVRTDFHIQRIARLLEARDEQEAKGLFTIWKDEVWEYEP